MKITLLLSPLLCALLSLFACRTLSVDATEITVTAAPEFTLDLFEQRDALDGHPTFGLWVESKATYDCSGYDIDFVSSVQGMDITIQLTDVQRPASCDGATSTARKFIPIGQLTEGAYRLTIALGVDGLLKTTGTLSVDQQQYTFVFSEPQGIDFQNTNLLRLPEGSLWGYVSRPDELDITLANAFLTDLKNATEEHNLSPGYYGYFTIGGTGLASLHKSVDIAGLREVFIRRLTNQTDVMRNLLQNYRSGIKPLQIRCWTTKGEL